MADDSLTYRVRDIYMTSYWPAINKRDSIILRMGRHYKYPNNWHVYITSILVNLAAKWYEQHNALITHTKYGKIHLHVVLILYFDNTDGFPTPEYSRIAGLLIAPAERMTSRSA